MKKEKFICVFFSALFLLSENSLYSQISSFGTLAKKKPEPVFEFTPYALIDLVRTAGFGVQYMKKPKFSLDLALYLIHPNQWMEGTLKEWDYLDFNGLGVSFVLKHNYNRWRSAGIGPFISVDFVKHGPLPVEHGEAPYYQDDPFVAQEEVKGITLTFGAAISRKFPHNKISVEPFAMLGVQGWLKCERTSNSATTSYQPYNTENPSYADLRFGIKLGYGLKKNYQHELLDQKFDSDFLPRYAILKTYIDSVRATDFSDVIQAKKTIKEIERANKVLLKLYRHNFKNQQEMYEVMDDHIRFLEYLVAKQKLAPLKVPGK